MIYWSLLQSLILGFVSFAGDFALTGDLDLIGVFDLLLVFYTGWALG